MKEFQKKKLYEIFTPDFILAIVLLGVAVQFAREVPTWFDIPQSDDNIYMHGGIYFLEMLSGTRYNWSPDWSPDWSPLFQFWFFLIYRLVPDSTKIYYISMQLVGILTPFFAFLLLRRVEVTRWLAAAIAAYFLASFAVWMAEPRVASFTSLIVLFLWWVLTFLKERWQRFVGLTVSSLILAYSRPEFFLMTLLLSLVTLTYVSFLLLKRGLKFHKRDFLFLGVSTGIILLFLVVWGIPFSGGRSIYAFGQHYAKTDKNCGVDNTSSDMAWEEILARDFGDVQGLGEVVRANPLGFRNHIICNIKTSPKNFLQVAFSSAWGSSWLVIRIVAALILFRMIVSWREIKERFIWLWKQDFLLLGIFSLGILMLDVIIIYPRKHYLAIFSVIVWILVISLFGKVAETEKKGWLQTIAIGLYLLFLTPSMGVLFNFEVPQKPILKTVEAVRALDFDEPIRLFATRPFRRSQSEIYFEDGYYHIGYKPAGISFDHYISSEQPNVIVITQGGDDLQDDSSWLAFEANPQEFGFHQIPFEEGDAWGPWRIYQKN